MVRDVPSEFKFIDYCNNANTVKCNKDQEIKKKIIKKMILAEVITKGQLCLIL